MCPDESKMNPNFRIDGMCAGINFAGFLCSFPDEADTLYSEQTPTNATMGDTSFSFIRLKLRPLPGILCLLDRGAALLTQI